MENRRAAGYIMAVTGFAMILVNACSYIFTWDLKSPAFGIIGLVFLTVGIMITRKSSR